MLSKIFLPTIFLVLGYGFWVSPDFKTITAGVAIFLFGMLSLEEGFKTFTGGFLERILKASTSKLWKSMSFGIVSTTLMQSSSMVSVVTISFLSAGLLELTSALGIIFGANLGTTTGAWLVAGFGLKINLSAYAMPMLAFGIVLVFQKSKTFKGAGYILAGLGFLFLGIHYMKEGFDSFGQTINLADYAWSGYPGVLAFTGIGILATVVMQSSHATLVLILSALAVQQVSYENALALAIGSNVGTTITAILGSLGANADGKRLAAAHLVFNSVTGLIAVIGIYQLMVAVGWISARLGIAPDNYTLQLAVFHSLFNVLGVALFLPMINPLVGILERVVPAEQVEIERPLYLSDASRGLADAAHEAVRRESIRLYDLAVGVINDGLNIRRDLFESDVKIKHVVRKSANVIDQDIDEIYERKLKTLYGAIVDFVIRTRGGYTEGRLREELNQIRQAGQKVIEAVKGVKHLGKNLDRFMRSDNDHIKNEYDRLRRVVVRVLRRIEQFRHAEQTPDRSRYLDTLRSDIENKMNEISGDLDELIRKNQITVQMATSMMNDISYCEKICQDLVDAAEVLFAEPETAQDFAADANVATI